MYWYDENKYLSQEQQLHNAQNVVTLLIQSNKGWVKESICAILGNMSQESNVNPNLYEKGFIWEADKGYGLVQWTPRSKLWKWAESQGLDPKKATTQIKRINYEIDNNQQWIKKQSYPITFKEFVTNNKNKDIEYLTRAFMINYERPYIPTAKIENRIAFAKLCSSKLKFDGVDVTDLPKEPDNLTVPNNNGDTESLSRKMIEIIEKFTNQLNQEFSFNLYDIDNKNYISNGKVTVFRYGNIYKVKYNTDFFEKIKSTIANVERDNGGSNLDYFNTEKEPTLPTIPSSSYNDNVKKLVDKALSIPLKSVRYSMTGARDMKSSGDCSSYMRYIFKAVNIDIGSVTTEQYNKAKQRGKLIFDGYSDKIIKALDNIKTGDFILMTSNKSNFVTGGSSHVVFVLDENTIIHQSASPTPYGPRKDNLRKYVKALINAGYGRWAIARYFE